MKRLLSVACLLLLAAPALADSVDEAEAKRRGVAVEVVQLENAKARIAVLEKQVADLQAQIAATKKAVAPPAASRAALKTEPSLTRGVTLEDARKSFPGIWKLDYESDGVSHYSVLWWNIAQNESSPYDEVATADFENGKLTTYTINHALMLGAKPPETPSTKPH